MWDNRGGLGLARTTQRDLRGVNLSLVPFCSPPSFSHRAQKLVQGRAHGKSSKVTKEIKKRERVNDAPIKTPRLGEAAGKGDSHTKGVLTAQAAGRKVESQRNCDRTGYLSLGAVVSP